MDSLLSPEAGLAVGSLLGCVIYLVSPVVFLTSLILAIVQKSRGWTIVAVVASLPGLALIGIFAWAMIEGGREASSTTTFSDPELHFTIEVPDNWREQEFDSESFCLQIGNQRREEFLLIIETPKADLAPEARLDGYAEWLFSRNVGALKNANRGDTSKLEINGLPARHCRIEGTLGEERRATHSTIIEGAERFYRIIAWSPRSREENAAPAFERAVASFREVIAADSPPETDQ